MSTMSTYDLHSHRSSIKDAMGCLLAGNFQISCQNAYINHYIHIVGCRVLHRQLRPPCGDGMYSALSTIRLSGMNRQSMPILLRLTK